MCIVDKSLVLERGAREAQLLVQLSFISIVQNPNNSCLKELKTFAALRSISMCYGNSASISK